MEALRETSTSDEALDFLTQLQQRRLAAEENVAQLEGAMPPPALLFWIGYLPDCENL